MLMEESKHKQTGEVSQIGGVGGVTGNINKKTNLDELVIKIHSDVEEETSKDAESSSIPPRSMPVAGLGYSHPDTSTLFSPSKNKPPKITTTTANTEHLLRRRSLARSVYSKPKSRFGEQPIIPDVVEEEERDKQDAVIGKSYSCRSSLNRGSPNNNSTNSIRTSSMKSKAASGIEDDEEEIHRKVVMIKEKKYERFNLKGFIQFVTLFGLCGCLVASLTIDELKKKMIWGLEFWKWCVVVLVTFCGMLVTNWFIHLVVFLIERNFLLRKKVLYFVHGLKQSVQTFIWLGFILLAWIFCFNEGSHQSKKTARILDYVTWTIVSLLIGSFLWLLKTLLLKILASNFQRRTFFDRIQESVFNQYVLQTLSGPPLIEEAMMVGRMPSTGQLSFRSTKKKGKVAKDIKVIDMGRLHQMKQEKVSAWTMKVLVDAVMNSGLSTISKAIDESVNGAGGEADKEITSEMEATVAAYDIFRNVAQPGSKYIEEEDLLRFMIKEEVDLVFPLFEGYENGRITRKALTNWVIKVYNGRKALAHALNDTKTAVKQLNKLVTGILIIVTIIVWLLLVEIATTKVLLVVLSQLVLVNFMFGSSCKTLFESIIFVFIMHPFDVGDRCVIDGIPLLVEEMNILTTVFLKLNFEKVYYPNSVLATKAISNYYRSPDMADRVDFAIDFATPTEKISSLRGRIKEYLERTPHFWHTAHNFAVNEIENVNKLEITLFMIHTMNFQDYVEKTKRRTELVMELKRMFEELDIKYNLLPQKIHLNPIHPCQLL